MVSLARLCSRRASGQPLLRIGPPSLLSTVLATFTRSLALLRPILVLGSLDSVAFEPVAIGINFGNLYSSIIYDVNGTITSIPNNQNQTSIPTCLAFTETGESFIGEAARRQWFIEPQMTICNLKDILLNRPNNMRAQAYEVVNDRELPVAQILLNGAMKTFTSEQLAGLFFQNLKDMAEDFVGRKVSDTVISVGLVSTDLEKHTIKRALEIGGFDRVHILRDDVLASLAYDLDEVYDSNGQSAFVLVYDIGASSIEVSIMEVEEGLFEVLSTTEDKSINESLLQSGLVDHVRELYPDLRDV